MDRAEAWLGRKLKDIRSFIDELYEGDLHAKRVDALAGATLGVMTGWSSSGRGTGRLSPACPASGRGSWTCARMPSWT